MSNQKISAHKEAQPQKNFLTYLSLFYCWWIADYLRPLRTFGLFERFSYYLVVSVCTFSLLPVSKLSFPISKFKKSAILSSSDSLARHA